MGYAFPFLSEGELMLEIERITGVLRRHVGGVGTPKSWRDFVAALPGADDTQGDEVGADIEIVGAQYVVDYVDSRGNASHRRIEIRRVDVGGEDVTLWAFCHERRAIRSFLASRIAEIYNAVTGEVIEDPNAYFRRLEVGSPTLEALERSAPGVQVLLCLAVCDERFDDDEVAVILRYMEWFTDSPDAVDWAVAEQFVRAAWPDLSKFDKAVTRLCRQSDDEVSRLLRWARKIVHADGRLGAEEMELMELLAGKAGHAGMEV